MYYETEYLMDVHGHPRSIISVPTESIKATFYYISDQQEPRFCLSTFRDRPIVRFQLKTAMVALD